ncbi:hypothetical protein AC1031_016557 [Aphanomyces cochlioides]|nr:hypothetical protein AC1031_016557 [Aphanomyces cochlioides]
MKWVWSALPVDIVVKIALFIPNPEDLFAFLQVLRPLSDLDLWPPLFLNSSILGSHNMISYETIVKYYANVIVEEIWDDVDWLKMHLNPRTKMEWSIHDSSVTGDTFKAFADLRITGLTV